MAMAIGETLTSVTFIYKKRWWKIRKYIMGFRNWKSWHHYDARGNEMNDWNEIIFDILMFQYLPIMSFTTVVTVVAFMFPLFAL